MWLACFGKLKQYIYHLQNLSSYLIPTEIKAEVIITQPLPYKLNLHN